MMVGGRFVMSDVFISYSRHNIQFAEQLFNALKTRHISAWVDWQDIPRSAGWWDEIIRGIDNASTFLFLMSNASLASPVCTLELNHAIENGKRILPVVIEPPQFDMAIDKLRDLEPDDVLTTIINQRDIVALSRHNHATIGHINWIFFNKNPQGVELPFEQSFDELLATIQTDLEHNRRHARLLVLAREWDSNQRDEDFLLIGDELIIAENWLKDAQVRQKEPIPTDLHIEFIGISRQTEDARDKRLRAIRRTGVVATIIALVASMVAVGGIIIANRASATANEAQRLADISQIRADQAQLQADSANHQVATATAVIATSVAMQQIAQSERDQAQRRSEIVSAFAAAILNTQSNPQQLIAHLTRLINQYPQEAMAYHVRGLAYYHQAAYPQAIADYEQAIRIDPRFNEAYFSRANAYFDLGNYIQAIADYTQSILLSPSDAVAYSNRGNAYMQMGDMANAQADYERAIAINPTYAPVYVNRGNLYFNIGEFDLALNDYTLAIGYDPLLVVAYINRGNTFYAKGIYAEAIADYDEAILLDADNALVYSNRGLAYRQLGDTAQAIANYNYAIQLNPQFTDAYINRAFTYFTLRDYARAIIDYSQALELDPDLSDVYYNRGLAYAFTNQLHLALSDFDQSIARGYTQAYLGRGLAHYIHADYQAALDDWAQYEAVTGMFPSNFESFRADAHIQAQVGD
jgi:tetratricopeptide (TPR) repeat protein